MASKLKPQAAPDRRVSLVYEAVAELKPDPRNPRLHSRAQIRQIAASIRSFGFAAPLLVDRTGTLICGAGRLEAARSLGMAHVPVVRLEDLSPQQARALSIADNRLVETSRWDQGLLAVHLKELSQLDLDFDLEATGFSTGEIDLKIEGLDAPAPEPEEEPFPSGPAVTRVGDLWTLDRHSLLCGDARDPQSYARLMGDAKASVVFTDPPWNVPVKGHVSGKGKRQHREFAMATGEMSAAEFTAFAGQVMGQLAAYSTPGSVHFVCIDWRHVYELIAAGRAHYDALINLCVWTKTNGGMGSLYRSAHELVTVWRNGSGPHRNNVELGRFGRARTNVWSYPGFSGLSRSEDADLTAQHPTPKPVAMIADALMDVSARGEVALDVFLGSGATLQAAERVGRVCRGMELDPLYADLAIRRWRRLTGQTAFLEGDGRSFDAIEAEAGR